MVVWVAAELTEEQDKQGKLEDGKQQVAEAVAALKTMADQLKNHIGWVGASGGGGCRLQGSRPHS